MRFFPSPRSAIAMMLLLPGAGLLGPTALSEHDSAPRTVLPVVNMEATVKAAQIDPRRVDDTLTPGAKASVLTVERALLKEGLLEQRWVDGYFGTSTVKAYSRYQTSLGYSGHGANGLPGASSLATLSQGRFTVSRVVKPGAKIRVGNGVVINTRTQRMLTEAERRLGRSLRLDQGSYNPGGDPTSVGTHDGGGVIDISTRSMSAQSRIRVVKELRKVGFAAWVRSPSQGNWPWHIHAVAMSDTDLSTVAQHQVGDYYLGLNGLSNSKPDDGPRVRVRTWEEYLRAR